MRKIMADFRSDQEIVTNFLLNTCQLRELFNHDDIQTYAAICAGLLPVGLLNADLSMNGIPVITGSVGEFYIEPMLSCVGDVDIMYHSSDHLAIPAGTAPPTQLPDEFDSFVIVWDIVDSEFPGYVYLVSSYFLRECVNDGKYDAEVCPRLYFTLTDNIERHGPAAVVPWSMITLGKPLSGRLAESRKSLDTVYCTRCLSWPTQAADWPTRHRNYGWPDSATVGRVVSNGCDVVRVAHRQCRRDEWMRDTQQRLSFSRAEIVLLNSWIPVQQIVCHMLRVFVKTEHY